MSSPVKAYTILSALFLTLISTGYWLFDREGLMWAFIMSLALHWLLYTHFEQKLLHLFQIRALEGEDPWGVFQALRQLSKRARIPLPNVYLVECPGLNAYSIARQHKSSSIMISRAAVERLENDELKALLAHEVARIRRLDTVLFSMTSAFTEVVLLFARIFEWRYLHACRIRRNFVNRFFLHLFSPLAWLVRKLLINHNTYYAIDELAAEYIDSPKTLARTLYKLDSYAIAHNFDVPASTAHLFTVNPLTKRGWARYFQAQPSAESRIRRLIGHYPI